jgi:signal transduction histidine kinase
MTTRPAAGTIFRPARTPGTGTRLASSVAFGEGQRRPGAYEDTYHAPGGANDVRSTPVDVADWTTAPTDESQAQRFRERMIAIVAHDLRNPVNAVLLTANTFAKKTSLPPDVRSGLGRIEYAAKRMNELIATLLDISAASFAGTIPISAVATDLRDVTEMAVDELRNAMPGRSVTVKAVGDTRGVWDPARIAQVVSNLVGNALTHGAKNGTVDVSVEGHESEVCLAVHNRGPVILPEVVPTLFDPFRRDAPSDHHPHRPGLGLYIAKQIVLSHGGTIAVDSTRERGTVFTVRLPRKR